MAPIVIVGSGLAGYNVARELRKLDPAAPLVLLSADSGAFYSKPQLSTAFGAKKTPAELATSTPEQMAEQLKATVRPRARVTGLELAAREVRVGEEMIAYTKLVLALGADPIRLPLQGDGADAVLSVNDLDDYARLRGALDGKRTVAILGAGLIGCEFANDLTLGGFQVHVIDLAHQPLPRLLPPEGAALLRDKLAALGVAWHLGTSVASVGRGASGLGVALANGEALDVDVVLSAIGLRPRVELARAHGIAAQRGITVNRFLETSAPDVHALGDCAEVEGLVLPYVMPLLNAARALGATLAGKRTAVAYPPMPVVVKTPACPTVVSPPAPGAEGAWEVEVGEESVKALFKDGAGDLLGFALNGKATAERAALVKLLPPVLAPA